MDCDEMNSIIVLVQVKRTKVEEAGCPRGNQTTVVKGDGEFAGSMSHSGQLSGAGNWGKNGWLGGGFA